VQALLVELKQRFAECNTLDVIRETKNMITKIRHPSLNLTNEYDSDKTIVELDQQLVQILLDCVVKFKNKFQSLNRAETLYSTHELTMYILSQKNNMLESLAKMVVDTLCNYSGYILIKNMPIYEDTDIALFILGIYIGRPMYNNLDRKYIWPLISEQIPSNKSLVGNTRYGNTGMALPFHTDTCTLAGLLCDTPSHTGGENEIISAGLVHNRIYNSNFEILKVLYHNFYIDRRGEQFNGMLPYAELPVFAHYNNQLQTFWAGIYNYEAYTKYPDLPPLTPRQLEAYHLLEETILQVASQNTKVIKLRRGDFLLVNNNLVFHSRKPFGTKDNNYRKLYRIWINLNQYFTLPHMFGYE